ncbi:MAG: internalization-like protein competence protein ComEC/Rec2, competence protein ComEC protein [Candidatus Taylorbacteria bacterium]|nr:internalization-like protein competence protein ComEC/Rec2, competence protein ComEC protein [Candidatus Taylorbacteria bacterium]
MDKRKKIAFVFLGILVLISVSFLFISRSTGHHGRLFISFLNIGQGDAIYIEAPNGRQIMIDGGPDEVVLRELGRVMPMFDRSIDAILITNPDKDHIGGFINIMQKYKVDDIIEPGTISPSDTYKTVESLAKKDGLRQTIARRGMNIMLDKDRNIYLHILFPDRDVSKLATNDGSIVAKLVYGDTSVLLQGDSPQNIEKYLLTLNPAELDTDILKTGHHGSRTSTSKEYVEAASPDFAVISCGVDNSYGHPHKETLDTLNSLNVPILRTDLLGRISFESDGKVWERTNF